LSLMPNHMHILFIQNDDLAKTIHKMKGNLAYSINKKLNKHGIFWARNYFDIAMRDAHHFQVTYDHIKNNAIKAKLTDADNRFYGLYEF
jgi:putative transposase